MEQFYTAKYQRYLYHLAKRKHDNLNLDEFKTYLKKIDKVSRQKRFIRAKEEADIFFKERKIRTLSSGVHFVKSIRYYPTYLPYIVSLKLRMIIRILIDKFKKRVFS